jgi:hypothetical protein
MTAPDPRLRRLLAHSPHRACVPPAGYPGPAPRPAGAEAEGAGVPRGATQAGPAPRLPDAARGA